VKDIAQRHGIAPQQLTTWRRAARQGRLALPSDLVGDEGFGFAALLVAEEPTPSPSTGGAVTLPAVEIVVGAVVIRLDGAAPAVRIAEIATALGARR
jgi:transposase